MSEESKQSSSVLVSKDLARRIRRALDWVPENAEAERRGDTTHYGRLATELVQCEGYPLEDEVWGDDPTTVGTYQDLPPVEWPDGDEVGQPTC